jgi:hypothetical protein
MLQEKESFNSEAEITNNKGFYVPVCLDHSMSEIRNLLNGTVLTMAIPDTNVERKCALCDKDASIFIKIVDWKVQKIVQYNNYSRFKSFVPRVEKILENNPKFINQLTTYLGLKDVIGHDLAVKFLEREKNQLSQELIDELGLKVNEMNFRIKRIKYLKLDKDGSIKFVPLKPFGVNKNFDSKGQIPLSDIDIEVEKMEPEENMEKETAEQPGKAKDQKTLLRERRISIYGARRLLKEVGFKEEILPNNVYKLTNGTTTLVFYLNENKVEVNGKAFTK